MSETIEAARQRVEALRGGGMTELGDALEALATAALELGDLGAGAAALEEAAGCWEDPRQANALLLAAAARRLSGDLGAAAHDLARANAVATPAPRALVAEQAEQDLARGDHDRAAAGFGAVLDRVSAEQEPLVRAQILQRRAAAAVAAARWRDAAADLMDAEALYAAHGTRDEAEASALGAAAAVANVDCVLAEEVLAAVNAHAPQDGSAAARRGVVGGRIAMTGGNPAIALARFDAARQASLDVRDPIAYLTAAAEGSRAAQRLEDAEGAYARLATAWVTLGDLLGADAGRELTRPLLIELRDQLGVAAFDAARAAYEQRVHD